MYYMYVKKSCGIDQSLSLNEFISLRLELCQINFKDFFFKQSQKSSVRVFIRHQRSENSLCTTHKSHNNVQ